MYRSRRLWRRLGRIPLRFLGWIREMNKGLIIMWVLQGYTGALEPPYGNRFGADSRYESRSCKPSLPFSYLIIHHTRFYVTAFQLPEVLSTSLTIFLPSHYWLLNFRGALEVS